jgi:hypothetical protein
MRCAGRRVLRDIARARRVAREAFAIPRPPRKRPLRGQSLIEREKVASSSWRALTKTAPTRAVNSVRLQSYRP